MSTPTAADDLIIALAHQGVTTHRIHEIFIGGDRNSWLVVTPAGRAIPDMDDTYVVTYLRDPSGGDAVTVEHPAESSDCWLTVIGGSTPAGTHYETLGRTSARRISPASPRTSPTGTTTPTGSCAKQTPFPTPSPD